MHKKFINFAVRAVSASLAGYLVFLFITPIFSLVAIFICSDSDAGCEIVLVERLIFLLGLFISVIVYITIFQVFSSRSPSVESTVKNIAESGAMLLISIAIFIVAVYQKELREYNNRIDGAYGRSMCYLDIGDTSGATVTSGDCEYVSYAEYYTRIKKRLMIEQQALIELSQDLIDETDPRLSRIHELKIFPLCPEDGSSVGYSCRSADQKIDKVSRIEAAEQSIKIAIDQAEGFSSGRSQLEEDERIKAFKSTNAIPTFYSTLSRVPSLILGSPK